MIYYTNIFYVPLILVCVVYTFTVYNYIEVKVLFSSLKLMLCTTALQKILLPLIIQYS